MFNANSADPDQLASSEANWSGSTLLAKAEYIRVQQDKGLKSHNVRKFTFRHMCTAKIRSACAFVQQPTE